MTRINPRAPNFGTQRPRRSSGEDTEDLGIIDSELCLCVLWLGSVRSVTKKSIHLVLFCVHCASIFTPSVLPSLICRVAAPRRSSRFNAIPIPRCVGLIFVTEFIHSLPLHSPAPALGIGRPRMGRKASQIRIGKGMSGKGIIRPFAGPLAFFAPLVLFCGHRLVAFSHHPLWPRLESLWPLCRGFSCGSATRLSCGSSCQSRQCLVDY